MSVPATAADRPLDKLVSDVEAHSTMLAVHHAIHDLKKVATVDAGVAMARPGVAVNAQLTVEYLP